VAKMLARCFVWKTLHVRGWWRGKPACTTRLGLSKRRMRCTLKAKNHSTAFDSIRQHSTARQREFVRWLDDTHLSFLLFPAHRQRRRANPCLGHPPRSRPQSARWKHAVVSRLAAAQVHLGSFSSTVVIPGISLARYHASRLCDRRWTLTQGSFFRSPCACGLKLEASIRCGWWVVGLKSLRLLLRVTYSIYHRRLATPDRFATTIVRVLLPYTSCSSPSLPYKVPGLLLEEVWNTSIQTFKETQQLSSASEPKQ
jgi:hypothetical protein